MLSGPVKILLLSFFVPLLIILLSVILHIYLTDSTISGIFDFNLTISSLGMYFYWTFLRTILGGGLGEEIGLRGFALPRMQVRFGIRKASFYLGVLWSFWHLPGNISSDISASIVSIVAQFILTVSLSFVFSWIYNRTNGNLLAVILFHGSLNAHNAFFENDVFPVLNNGEDSWIVFYLFIVLILGILAFLNLKTLDVIEEKA